MKFIVVLVIAIGILYWLKQKGVKKDREIEQERMRRERAAKEKQREKETIRELREEIDRLNERLDEQEDYL